MGINKHPKLDSGEVKKWEHLKHPEPSRVSQVILICLAIISTILAFFTFNLFSVISGITIIFGVCTSIILLVCLVFMTSVRSKHQSYKNEIANHYLITNKRVIVYKNEMYYNIPLNAIQESCLLENEDQTVDLILTVEKGKIPLKNLPAEEGEKALKFLN